MCILKDPRAYVTSYLENKNIVVNERGELNGGIGLKNDEVFNTLYLDYVSIVGAHNAQEKQKLPSFRNSVSIISEKIMKMALTELITLKKVAYRQEVIRSIMTTTPSEILVRKFVKAVTGELDEDDVAVIAHWMWQVKVKMSGGYPTYHVMPILFGKQEGGKTYALNRLIAPINNFRLNIGMDEMSDGRFFKSMSENFVVVFDEMQGAVRTDIDALKKQVTIADNDYRPLGTNDVFKVRQACSFIGATNRSVAEQIQDATGMRRFYELRCQDKLDWESLAEIDYTALWQSIDETRVDGYILPRIESIRKKQSYLIAEDEIGLFMDACGLVVAKTPTKKVPTSELYERYRFWAASNGFTPKAINWFGRSFAGKGFPKGIQRSGSKTIRYFDVNSDYIVAIVPQWDTNLSADIAEAYKVLKMGVKVCN